MRLVTCQPAHSWVGDAVSGAKIEAAPCFPSLAVVHLPLCLQGGRSLNTSWLSPVVFPRVQSFVLWVCQGSQSGVRDFLQEKSFVFLCLPGIPTVWVVLSLKSPQSVLRVFNPSPYPKDLACSLQLHTQPLLAVGRQECVNHFSDGNCLWCEFCGDFILFYFYYAALWDFKVPPLTPPVKGFPIVVETSPPSGFPPQDRYLSLNPLSLFLYLLSYLILKRLVCISGYLGSSASVQKLFCGRYSKCRYSFDVFVGGKWSLILFLHHLGTTSCYILKKKKEEAKEGRGKVENKRNLI